MRFVVKARLPCIIGASPPLGLFRIRSDMPHISSAYGAALRLQTATLSCCRRRFVLRDSVSIALYWRSRRYTCKVRARTENFRRHHQRL